MAMLSDFRPPDAFEAEENLRMIRSLMERSTKHSTFSGLSGVLAGLASIVGCLVTRSLNQQNLTPEAYRVPFLITWTIVIFFAITSDYLLTKRRAASVGKRVISRLGKQMIVASAPGLGTGILLTGLMLGQGLLSDIYPVWMLCYGIAVSAVGLFSQREVTLLGRAFLIAGAITLTIPQYGLIAMATTFGGFHIYYGIAMSRKDGWQ